MDHWVSPGVRPLVRVLALHSQGRMPQSVLRLCFLVCLNAKDSCRDRLLSKALDLRSAHSERARWSGLHDNGFCPAPWLSTQQETPTQDGQVWMKALERRPLGMDWLRSWLLVTNPLSVWACSVDLLFGRAELGFCI